MFQFLEKSRYTFCGSQPDPLHKDFPVFMGEDITLTNDLHPGNFRVFFLVCFRDMGGSLTNDR